MLTFLLINVQSTVFLKFSKVELKILRTPKKSMNKLINQSINKKAKTVKMINLKRGIVFFFL